VLKDGSAALDDSIKSLRLPKFTPLTLDLSKVIQSNLVLKNYTIKQGELETFVIDLLDMTNHSYE